MDGPGGHRHRCAGTSDHVVAADALQVPSGRLILGESHRGPAERVRRARGAEDVTSKAPAPGATAPARRIAARPSQILKALGDNRRQAEPCTIVILGVKGDLAKRKLFPAIYQLARDHLLPKGCDVLGVAREPMDDDAFRRMMYDAVRASDEVPDFDEDIWRGLASRMYYVAGDLSNAEAYQQLTLRLEEIESRRARFEPNRLFYLAVPPNVFAQIVRTLSASGLAPRMADGSQRPWYRIVIEKPFGASLETARALNRLVLELFNECQLYRIDHYLGKETVQSIL